MAWRTFRALSKGCCPCWGPVTCPWASATVRGARAPLDQLPPLNSTYEAPVVQGAVPNHIQNYTQNPQHHLASWGSYNLPYIRWFGAHLKAVRIAVSECTARWVTTYVRGLTNAAVTWSLPVVFPFHFWNSSASLCKKGPCRCPTNPQRSHQDVGGEWREAWHRGTGFEVLPGPRVWPGMNASILWAHGFQECH